ncbi:MAG: DEAD/DEAH box helicase [Candidatus Thermoplasmatota archaeon]
MKHPLMRPGRIEERAYQLNIAKDCLERSTLVVLHTALGKTVIAIMVMAEILHRKGGKVLLLAPTKPLVEQHAQSIRDFLILEDVAVFTGEVPPSKRAEMWSPNRIVVSTPQVIVNDLIAGKISLTDVSLLIFDEAHRAVGDYAYVFIAEKYREIAQRNAEPPSSGTDAPPHDSVGSNLVLGITASPGSDPQKVMEVCGNLGIENVEIRTEHDADVIPYIHDIKEEWVRVSIPQEAQRVSSLLRAVFKDLVEKLRGFGVLPKGKPIAVKDILAAQQIIQGRMHAEGRKNQSLYHALSLAAAVMKLNHALTLAETQGIGALLSYMEKLHEDRTKAARMLLSDQRIRDMERIAGTLRFEHPKVARVVAIVEEELRRNPDASIIVFTQYREIAEMVVEELSQLPCARPKRFVGQASREGDRGLRQKEQVALIQRFKDREINVLVATSVAEEGLDIPSTDLVIFYEPVPSEIRTIQRRGRTGRKRPGRVVYLITRATRDEGSYWTSRRKERQMHSDLDHLRSELKKRIAVGEAKGEAFKAAIQAVAGDLSPRQRQQEGGTAPHPKSQRRENGQASLLDFAAPVRARVLVDTRELNSQVAKELAKLGLEVISEALEIGDYIVSDRIAVERKEAEDFLTSLMDQRLFQQLGALKRAYQRPVLLIEGEGLFTKRNIAEEAIYGALASIIAGFGIPVIFSKDAVETSRYIAAMVKRERSEGGRLPMRSSKPKMLLHEQQEFVIEGLPGISATLAQRLLTHFGSVRAVISATEEELREVKGIGKTTAREISRIISERYLSGDREIE